MDVAVPNARLPPPVILSEAKDLSPRRAAPRKRCFAPLSMTGGEGGATGDSPGNGPTARRPGDGADRYPPVTGTAASCQALPSKKLSRLVVRL